MKKLSKRHWRLLVKKSKSRSRKFRINGREQSFFKAIGSIELTDVVKTNRIDYNGNVRRSFVLKAPADFRYSQNSKQIMSFVYSLRREALLKRRIGKRSSRKERRLYIDLDDISSIDLEGGLILAAELDRIKHVYAMRPTLDDGNWRPHIRSMLHKFGMYDLIDANRADNDTPIFGIQPILNEERLIFVPFKSGTKVIGSLADDLQDSLVEEDEILATNRAQLYEGIIEAIKNTTDHAYDGPRGPDGPPVVKRWWAGGFVDCRANAFCIAVYNQGAGIPATLPKQDWWRNFLPATEAHRPDHEAIASALEYGASRIGTSGRGNGLWRMCSMLEEFRFENANVRITSGAGQVTYEKGGRQKLEALDFRFSGTLIRWMASLPEGSMENDQDIDR